MTEEHAYLETLRIQQSIQRTKTWKQVEVELRERRDQLEDVLGRTGLSADDRTMLHGRLAFCVEMLLHLPRILAERELADRTPSLTADDSMAVLTDPVQRPELM
jgi:hypothetical protein